MALIGRPERDEYADFYHTYVGKVPEGDVFGILRRQHEVTQEILGEVDEEQAEYRYAPGKWSIKEVVGHLADTERIFAYRALAIARRDPSPLPGMDQDVYVKNGAFGERTLEDLADEWRYLRRSNLHLFNGFGGEVQLRKGIASGVEFTVRALVYVVAGHERHHQLILRERYL